MTIKRFLLLTIVLGFIGVTPALAEKPKDPTVLKAKPASSEKPKDQTAYKEALIKFEKGTWEMAKSRDVSAMKTFYPSDVVFIFSDGVRFNKEDQIKSIPNIKLQSYAIDGKVDVVMFTPDVATLIYRVKYETTGLKGENPRKVAAIASSTYVRRAGKWVNTLYQETNLK